MSNGNRPYGTAVAAPMAPASLAAPAPPFRLGQGEMIKATYPLTRTRGVAGRLDAHLYVTDARVVYRAQAHNWFNSSVEHSEIQLTDVCGFGMARRRGLTPGGILAAIALAIAALPMLASIVLIPLLFVAAFVVFFLLRNSAMAFTIQSRNTGASPIVLSNGGGHNPVVQLWRAITNPFIRMLGWLGILDASVASSGASTPEAQVMFEEIGALVLDLQGRGVLAGLGQ